MRVSKYYIDWHKKLFLFIVLLCQFDIAKADNTAYYEYRSILDTYKKMLYGDNLKAQRLTTNFYLSNDLDDEYIDEENLFITDNTIHFNIEVRKFIFFDKIIDFIVNSVGNQHDNSVYDVKVSELFHKEDHDIECDLFQLSPIGSYRFEITKYRELTTSDSFVFSQDGLTFSSDKFLYPIFQKIKDWYVTDYWCFDFGKEFFQWTFEVLCGQIVKAELLIEYGTGDTIVINLLDDNSMIGSRSTKP